jgi:hypothetical protein
MKFIKTISPSLFLVILFINVSCEVSSPDKFESDYIKLNVSQGNSFDSSKVVLGEYNISYKKPISLKNAVKINLNYNVDSLSISTSSIENSDSTSRLILFFVNKYFDHNVVVLKNNDTILMEDQIFTNYRFDGTLYIFSFSEVCQNDASNVSVNISLNGNSQLYNVAPINHNLDFQYALHLNSSELNADKNINSFYFEFQGSSEGNEYMPILFSNNSGEWSAGCINFFHTGYYGIGWFDKMHDDRDFYVIMLEK